MMMHALVVKKVSNGVSYLSTIWLIIDSTQYIAKFNRLIGYGRFPIRYAIYNSIKYKERHNERQFF